MLFPCLFVLLSVYLFYGANCIILDGLGASMCLFHRFVCLFVLLSVYPCLSLVGECWCQACHNGPLLPPRRHTLLLSALNSNSNDHSDYQDNQDIKIKWVTLGQKLIHKVSMIRGADTENENVCKRIKQGLL